MTRLTVWLPVVIGALAGCQPDPPPLERPVDCAPVAGRPGICSYGVYAVAIARDGETVKAVAMRVGLPASELAVYNGVSESLTLRAGQELVVPPG